MSKQQKRRASNQEKQTAQRKMDMQTSILHTRPLILAVGLATLTLVAASFLLPPDVRIWSANYLHYVSREFNLILLILFVASIVIAIRYRISSASEKMLTAAPWFLFIGLALFATVFRLNTFFYGDGGLLPPQIYQLSHDLSFESDILLNLKSSPLAGSLLIALLHIIPAISHALGIALPTSPLYPFLYVSLLSLAVLFIAVRFFGDTKSRATLALFVLGTGGSIFFFGYVEFYTLVFSTITFYLISAKSFLDSGRNFWVAIAAFIVSVGAHYFTLALLPSLLFLIGKRFGILRSIVSSTKNVMSVMGLMIGVGIIVYFASGAAMSDNRITIPFSPLTSEAGTQSYTLLSSYHLIDFVNLFFLLSPLPFVFTLLSLKKIRASGFIAGDPFRFFALSFAGFAAFLFFANTSLGLARDWDIAAPLGIIVSLGIFAYFQHEKNGQEALRFGILSLIFALPWIAVNVDESSGARRFEQVMEYDAGHMYADYALSGYEALRKFSLHRGDLEKNILLTRKMISVIDYPSNYNLLLSSIAPWALSKPDAYLSTMGWMIERLKSHRAELESRHAERDYAISRAQIDSLFEAIAYQSFIAQKFDALRNLFPNNPDGSVRDFPSIRGLQSFFNNKFSEAITAFEDCEANNFHVAKLQGLRGMAFLELGKQDEAFKRFDEALLRFPTDPELRFMIALAYFQKNIQPAKAKTLLEDALTLTPSTDLRNQIQSLLSRLILN